MKVLSGPLRFSLICWSLSLPLALMPWPAHETSFFGLSVLLISFSFLGICAACSRAGEIRWPGLGLMVAGLLFWLLALASVLWSEVRFESFLYFWFFSALPFSFLIFTLAPQKDKLFKAAAVAAGALMVFLSLSSLAQFLFFPEMLFYGRVQFPLANPNSLAGLLSLGFFGFFGWMLGARDRRQSNIALALALLAFAALVTTGSRGAFLSLLAGAAVLIALVPGYVKQHKRCLGVLLAGGIVLFGVLSWAAPFRSAAEIAVQTASGELPGLWTRPYIWAAGWEMIKDHFWGGTGIGTFYLYYPAYRLEGDFHSAGLHAHSDPIQFWTEMGVAAPLLFYGFLVMAMARTARALKAAEGTPRLMIAVSVCGLGAMILHSHITFHFHVLSMLVLSGALLAFWYHATGEVLKERVSVLGLRQVRFETAMLPLAVFVLALAGFLSAAASEVLTQRAEGALYAGDLEGYAADVNKAADLSFKRSAKPFVMAASVPVGVLESGGAEDAAALEEKARGLLAQARALNPRLAGVPYHEARLALANGKREEALYFLRETLALNPLHLKARRSLAALLAQGGEAEEAYEVLKAGLVWPYKEEDGRAYYLDTALMAVEFGDHETQALAWKKAGALQKPDSHE